MDWQAFAVNLILSAIIAILLILANWIVNIWEQRSSWGQWKEIFMRYPTTSSMVSKVQKEKSQILMEGTKFNGILFVGATLGIVVEMVLVPILSSWLQVDPRAIHLALFGSFFLLEGFLLSIILTKVLFREDFPTFYAGLRYITYTLYTSVMGTILTTFNLSPSKPSAVFSFVVIQSIIVSLVLVSSKYLELSLFNYLWNIKVRNSVPAEFPYVNVTLRYGGLVGGKLIDFMDKSALVLKRGMEYIHVNWNEIEIIRILDNQNMS